VHAVTLHLFRNDVGWPRESWTGVDIDYSSMAQTIEQENDKWVEAARRIPPTLMPELLVLSGDRLDGLLACVDMDAPGIPVAWSGSGPSPVWLDIAREYTERWVHHQQIRDATNRAGLKDREWMHPVFRTFMLALPRAYDPVQAPKGTRVRVVVSGHGGGTWCIQHDEARWRLVDESESVSAEVRLPEELAWRLYVRTVSPEEAMSDIVRHGSAELTEPACRAVATMTSSA
jgi:hypothetical protein